MPPLNEGSLMYMPNTLPAVSVTTQRRLLHVEDSILMAFTEVASVWGKAGRANTATDWAPMSMVETVVNLKPRSEWRAGMRQDRPIAGMARRVGVTGAGDTGAEAGKNCSQITFPCRHRPVAGRRVGGGLAPKPR